MSHTLNAIDGRFKELLREGTEHLRDYFAATKTKMDTRLAHGWLVATLNLIHLVTRGRSVYYEQAIKITEITGVDNDGKPYLPVVLDGAKVARMHGVLENVYKDWQTGLLRQIEFIVAAESFDQFLRQAEAYHKSGKHMEAGVLVSAVFEDALKKVAQRNGINHRAVYLPCVNRT